MPQEVDIASHVLETKELVEGEYEIRYGTRACCPKCNGPLMLVLTTDGSVHDGIVTPMHPVAIGWKCAQCRFAEAWKP
jgi:hypothetical protein